MAPSLDTEKLGDLKETLSATAEPVETPPDSPVAHKIYEEPSESSCSRSTYSAADAESIHVHSGDGQGPWALGEELTITKSRISVATSTGDPAFEVDWEADDPGNPQNWSGLRKAIFIFFISYSTMTVVCYSTAYTATMPGIQATFHLTEETLVILGVTTYLIGLAVGSVILAPLSEMYGRRPVYLVAMALFCIWIIPCGIAKNLETILVSRFFGAFAGAAMVGNAPGTINDIISEEYRALAFSIWSIGPMNGPVSGIPHLEIRNLGQAFVIREHRSLMRLTMLQTGHWSTCRRVRVRIRELAMDELGHSDLCWRLTGPALHSTGDLFTFPASPAGCQEEKGDG